jgi:hypothetical protein
MEPAFSRVGALNLRPCVVFLSLIFFIKLRFEVHVKAVNLNHFVLLPGLVALPCLWLLSEPEVISKVSFEVHVETVYLNPFVGLLPHVVALPCRLLLSQPDVLSKASFCGVWRTLCLERSEATILKWLQSSGKPKKIESTASK